MKKILANKKTLAFFVAILLTTSALLVMLPIAPVQGQQLAEQQPISGALPSGITPDVEAETTAYLSFRPNPVGKDQPILINIWITPAPGAQRFFPDLTLTITRPDGTKDTLTMDSYVADGTNWLEIPADQTGEWTFKLEFPGVYYPAGRYLAGQVINATSGGQVYAESVYCKPSSTQEQKLTVQEDMVWSWPASSLPTDYWTRPVTEENREWWSILGNYPWYGPGGGALWDELYPETNPYANSAYGFTPWVQGPDSSHVVWKRQYHIGGLLGGDMESASSVYWPLNSWGDRPTVILAGRGYQVVTKPGTTSPSGQTYWQCYDIRTGEIFWERPLFSGETEPNIIEYGITSLDVPGVQPKPDTPYLLSIGNGYLRKYDPMNGYMLLNTSIAPLTGAGGTYYMNGYCLGIQDLGSAAGAERYRLINWTTFGTTTNFASRIMSNTTYARSSLPSSSLTDYNEGAGVVITGISAGGIYVGQRIESFDLTTGQLLWNKTIDEPQYSVSADVADHGKIAILSAKGYYQAYDLRTGELEWQTDSLDYPWDEPGWGSYSIISAYGRIYWVAMTGIYAIDWDDGNLDWKFEIQAPFPYETEYTGENGTTVYPFHAPGMCADGKLYIYASEHSPETPYYRGLPTMCINATSGEPLWEVGISGCGQHGRSASQLRIADGYMMLGSRDGYMYVFGKGKSETTVTAPNTVVTKGSGIMIKGTVLDLSPAQPGTACVSKESMTLQMEYLHLQTPVTGVLGNETMIGVPVSIDAVDPNGNYIHLGDVTSDGYSGTFGFTWEPELEGQYTITATFMGDESYGSSFATTYVSVSEAPVETIAPTQTPLTMPPYELYTVGSALAVIVAIVLALLLLRKKP